MSQQGRLALLLAMLILFSGAGLSIQTEELVLTFSPASSRQKIMDDASIVISRISSLGYDTGRLDDILSEASTSEGGADFLRMMGNFRNTTLILSNLRNDEILAKNDLILLRRYNLTPENADHQLDGASTAMIEGRYEDAKSKLDGLSKEILNRKSGLILSIKGRFNETVMRLEAISDDNVILAMQEEQIKRLNTSSDANQIKLMDEETTQIEESLVIIEQLAVFSDYERLRGVNSTLVSDGLTESLYFIRERRYDKAAALLATLQATAAAEKIADKAIKEAETELISLPDSDTKSGLLTEFDSIREGYITGDYGGAKAKSDLLLKKVWDAKSEIILEESTNEKKITISGFIKGNLPVITILLLAVAVLILISRKYLTLMYLTRQSRYLEAKKLSIFEAMKDLQRKYYAERKISRRAYLREIRQSQMRYAEMTKRQSIVKQKLKK